MALALKVLKGTGIITATDLLKRAINIAITFILANYFSKSDYGNYNLIFAYMYFFGIFTDLGSEMIIVREAMKYKEKASLLIGNGFILRLLLSAITMLFSWFILLFMGYNSYVKKLIFIYSFSLLFSVGSLFSNIFLMKIRLLGANIIHLSFRILHLLILLYLVKLNADLSTFVILTTVIVLPEFIIMGWMAFRMIKPEFTILPNLWVEVLRQSWPIALNFIFISFLTRIDQLLIYKMAGDEALGGYALAAKISELSFIIPFAFLAIMFPLFARFHKESQDKFKKAYIISFQLISILLIPALVVVFFYSKKILHLIAGDKYLFADKSLIALMAAMLFSNFGVVNNRLMITCGLQKLELLFTSSSAVLNIILNLTLIPTYGIFGAALATLFSYPLGPILGYFLRPTHQFSKAMAISLKEPIIAGIGMGLCLHFMPTIIPGLLAGLLVYVGIVFLLLKKEDFIWLYNQTKED